jgi:nitroreductase
LISYVFKFPNLVVFKMNRENKGNLLDVIMTRKSVREFKPGNIPLEDVKRITRAGIMAPSASNSQPWRFHIVRGKTKRRLAEKLNETKTLLPLYREFFGGIFETVPIVIMVENAVPPSRENFFSRLGTAASVENMLLAIHSLGYGSVWIGLPPILEAARKVVRVTGELVAVLPVGYPADNQSEYTSRARRSLGEVTRFYD